MVFSQKRMKMSKSVTIIKRIENTLPDPLEFDLY